MTVCYCTNIWSHHQGPVCVELARLLKNNFKMVMFQPLDCDWSQERIRMGWNLVPPSEPWIVPPPKSRAELLDGKRDAWLLDADVAVIGISPYMNYEAILRRIRVGKLTFVMGERYFKEKRYLRDFLNVRSWHRWFSLWRLLHRENVHFLTMNHWMKDDLAFLRVCRGRTWRWAYMTPLSAEPPRERDNSVVRIGWCGRMFDWKQTILGVLAFSRLPEDVRRRCRFEIVGQGDMSDELHRAVRSLGLEGVVLFMPMKPHSELMDWMRGLDIYLFTSNRKEGWGAALVEAMDCGCAVIANWEAGATLDVVEDGVSGFVFADLDVDDLSRKMRTLIEDPEMRMRMGRAAWQSVKEVSPGNGASHFVQLVRSLLGESGACPPEHGLCTLVR